LHHDLIYTYKVLFGKTNMDCANICSVAQYATKRGHPSKLYANYCRTCSLRKLLESPKNYKCYIALHSVAAFKSL